jgi:phenylalanyl-tRNA synthetase beta chain
LVDALVYSRRRETEDVRLFEVGAAFLPAGETTRVAWLLTGERTSHWSGNAGSVDFFDAKGVAEFIGEALGRPIVARATEARPWFLRGRAADLFLADADAAAGTTPVGSVGQLRADLIGARGLGQSGAVVGGEIDLRLLAPAVVAASSRIDALPRHPSIVRDLSIVIAERLPAEDVRGTIRSAAPITLVAVHEFDRYQGKGVPDGCVSLSVRLTFRDRDRTLTDAEVQRAVEAIVTALAVQHGAVLRGRAD